jgi:hypothetical protein
VNGLSAAGGIGVAGDSSNAPAARW